MHDVSKAPKNRRMRRWPLEMRKEIRRLRERHPNIGKEKVHVLLVAWCAKRSVRCPGVRTIGRLIADAPDKMISMTPTMRCSRIWNATTASARTGVWGISPRAKPSKNNYPICPECGGSIHEGGFLHSNCVYLTFIDFWRVARAFVACGSHAKVKALVTRVARPSS